MEALIHHFKLVTEGFRVPPGEIYYPIEGPRGESAASSAPTARRSRRGCTCATRASSTCRRAPMVRGAYIADLIATLAMLDPILGGIDR